ncbi:YidC/Oxa1 family membrane protein insertase [Actinomadura sp. HBU206391]|uniref:YidC/Oxa1 family membrane protein insertase n=1 Tax=Actinomadura sp. HBU206391 TaxID=2731692 RepID=UPI0016507D04|nr:membrane protein insertase YidC [Actinomadura sp. HBU206391]MBC6459813.1 membrane protein insertase YidC [Actinomadura sp. HBU206391]
MLVLDAPVGAAYHLVTSLTTAIHPVSGQLSTSAAIILFTLGLRTVLLPLAVRQARAERTRLRLQPRVDELRRKHGNDPRRQHEAISELYAVEDAKLLGGCLPALAQWPFFMVMYRLFVSASIAGHQNALLTSTLLGAPLGQSVMGTLSVYGLFTAPALVCLGLLALIAAVAWRSSRRAGRSAPAGAMGLLTRTMPYGTVVVALFVPLAAALYLLTTTAWTATERALLHRGLAPAR